MSSPAPKRENLLLNIVFNVALPSILLTYLSKPAMIGPVWGLIVALSFPLGYGIWDFIQRRQTNFVSVVGFVSVLLTGVFALIHVNRFWFAIKEAAIPTVIGIAILASLRSKRPLVRQLLYNDQVIDVPRIDAALQTRGTAKAFDRHLREASLLLAGSFAISAVLNFALARFLIRSDTGTPEFNAELGKMNALSWPIIVIPCLIIMLFALWRLMKGISRLTGLTTDEILRSQQQSPATQ